MNKPVVSQPRRTTTKEASERFYQPKENYNYDVMAILADPYPRLAEDYAVQLFYRSKENRRNPFFKCTEKKIESDGETAHITINGSRYQVNIRTGIIHAE